MNVPRVEKNYQEISLEIIEQSRKRLENIILDSTEERKERYRKVFEKICEIENITDRTFVVIAFVSELERTKKILGQLLNE